MIYIKLNMEIDGHPVGRILRLDTDDGGVIRSKFWRKRIKDSATDKCVEILKKKPKEVFLNG